MLTRTQICELVDVARAQDIGDVIIPAFVGWADKCDVTFDDVPADGYWYVGAWLDRTVLVRLCEERRFVHAHKTGIALLAYAVGSDLSWQLADDVQDNCNPLAISALLDLVTDCCPV
jgi:hypothetical protein